MNKGNLAWFSQENDDSANRSQYGIFPLNKLRYFWYGQQDWELAPKAWNISEPRWVWLSKLSMPPKCIYPTTELWNWCHLISSPRALWYLRLILLPQSFLSGEKILRTEFQNLPGNDVFVGFCAQKTGVLTLKADYFPERTGRNPGVDQKSIKIPEIQVVGKSDRLKVPLNTYICIIVL